MSEGYCIYCHCHENGDKRLQPCPTVRPRASAPRRRQLIILAESEVALMFQTDAGYETAMQWFEKHEDGGMLTDYLDEQRIPYIELAGVVLFQTR